MARSHVVSSPAVPRIITLPVARRIALGAQGFSRPRPAGAPSTRQILATVQRLGLLQLDSVNVFERAHYMPVFSRLGPYDRARLDRMAGHSRGRIDRRLIEYWAHEASLVPLGTHPLLRWRMDDVHGEAWGSISRIVREQPELVQATRDLVTAQGPIRARDTGAVRADPRPGHMWNWHEGKVALEHLFFTGEVVASRRVNFERRYDLAQRVLPAEILNAPTPEPQAAQRELVRISARALGIATEPDLGDYFRLPRADSKARVAELVQTGELEPVSVRGWDAPAYLWAEAARPRRIRARALLSPFDPLIWFRPRTERLFGFHYRIEIYVPEPQRRYGYYVLPFLLDEALVARVDLKSDRQAGVLRVQGAFAEPGADIDHVAAELAAELTDVARWQGLDAGVAVSERGDLIGPLRRALG